MGNALSGRCLPALVLALALVAATPTLARAAGTQRFSVRSPHGTLTAAITVAGGRPTMTVSRYGRVALTADLGVAPRAPRAARGGRGGRARVRTSTIADAFSTTAGKRRQHTLQARRTSVWLRGGARIDVLAADDGIATRERGMRSATVDYTAPGGSTGFLQRLEPSYENSYAPVALTAAAPGDYGYPALLAAPDGTYSLLTEAGLPYGRAGGRLTVRAGRPGVLTTRSASPAPVGEAATAWRVAVIGGLGDVVSSDLPLALARPSNIADTSWIRPGRVAWSWWSQGTVAGLAQQRGYVDFAARERFEYVLVDAGWDASWVPSLVAYAAERGVRVLLWTDWRALADPAQRRAMLDRWASWGVAGIKVDFLLSDSGPRMAVMDDIAADAARRRLVVDFHGCTVPRGLQRTWPNVLTAEAVRGAEYQRGGRADDPAANVTLAFTRNAVASMDYTPVTFSAAGRRSSAAAELAQSVVFESGLQHFADSPGSYASRPAAMELLAQVPAAWDDVRLVDGAPARSVTLARRSGDRWFIGSLSATAPRVQAVPLRFLAAGRRYDARIYADDGRGGIAVTRRAITASDTLTVPLATDGGFAVMLSPSPR